MRGTVVKPGGKGSIRWRNAVSKKPEFYEIRQLSTNSHWFRAVLIYKTSGLLMWQWKRRDTNFEESIDPCRSLQILSLQMSGGNDFLGYAVFSWITMASLDSEKQQKQTKNSML